MVLENPCSLAETASVLEGADLSFECELALIKGRFFESLSAHIPECDEETFWKSLNADSKHPKMLTPYSIEDLRGFKLFVVPGFHIGFALSLAEEGVKILSVHNNDKKLRSIGRELMHIAIFKALEHSENIYVDHYDGFLSSFYASLGFEEVSRLEFDPYYDPDGSFESKYGRQDVIYRKLNLTKYEQ